MDINKRIEAFNKVQRVSVPDTLWQKINEKISLAKEAPVTTKLKWASAVAAILIISLNLFTIINASNTTKGKMPTMMDGFFDNSSNNFYK